MSLLFLSPCLCEGNFGGVQLSGRLARAGLRRMADDFGSIYYRSGDAARGVHQDCTASKFSAVARSVLERPQAGRILIWHIDMLKLLPFAKKRQSRTWLFLHGIECWKIMSRFTETLLESVDVFLTNSAFTWSQFLRYNPRWRNSQHRVLPLGVGEIDRNPVARNPDPSAVVVGRMEEREGYKGHRELIHAWPLVRAIHPSAQLWIVGGGDLESELRTLAESLGMQDAVRFHGRVSDERKAELIGQSRCLLLPSRGEGFGLVYLEAMRQGRPCLVSTVDAGREVVRPPEAGLAVDPADIQSMSAAAARLLASGPEWDGWSARAKALYDSNFTAAHFQERLISALQE